MFDRAHPVERMRDDPIRREQSLLRFPIDDMRRTTIYARGGNLIRRQNEFTAATFTMKDLLVQRLAVSACGGHGDEEILFPRKRGGAGLDSEFLAAGAILTRQRLTVRREYHAASAFGAHETPGIRFVQSRRRGRQVIGINDLIGLEFAIEDRERPPRPCMSKIVRKAILERLAFLHGIIDHLAHPEPGLGEYIMEKRKALE